MSPDDDDGRKRLAPRKLAFLGAQLAVSVAIQFVANLIFYCLSLIPYWISEW